MVASSIIRRGIANADTGEVRMDTTTVFTVLFSNIAIATVSLLTTRWQIGSAKKNLEMQISSESQKLEMQKEVEAKKDRTNRRREVRSEPLLRLRTALAVMAAKQERFTGYASMKHTNMSGVPADKIGVLLEQARDSLNAYVESGEWSQCVFMLDDATLVDKAKEIINDYRYANFIHFNFQDFRKELPDAMKVFDKNVKRVAELQELINKRLEEL